MAFLTECATKESASSETTRKALSEHSNISGAQEYDPAYYPKPEGGFVGLDGLSAVLVRPTYSNMQVRPENSLVSSLQTASNHGVKWHGNLSPDRMGWGHARNSATESFYKDYPDTDGMLWVDSDIIMPIWAMWKLLSCAAVGYDFVSGIYFNRGNPWAPVIYEYRPYKGGYANVQSFPPNRMWKIDGCGFGFVWTSRRLIEAIHDHEDFNEKEGWFPDNRFEEGGAGEDMNFCKKAVAAGFQPWADTSILLGHEGSPRIYSILDHKRAHDKVK